MIRRLTLASWAWRRSSLFSSRASIRRPLIREREACAAVVTEFLESAAGSPHRETAQSLLAAMQRVDAVRPPELSEREKEVLERLGGLQDKQIARPRLKMIRGRYFTQANRITDHPLAIRTIGPQIGTMNRRRAVFTRASTLLLSLPLPGRPKRSRNR